MRNKGSRAGAGSPALGASQNTLGRVLGLTQPGSEWLVDRLVSAGLVERRAVQDRRTHAVVVTTAGHEAADQALLAWAGAAESVEVARPSGERKLQVSVYTAVPCRR